MKFDFVAYLPLSLPVKEFLKSVNIWGSYGQEFGVLFFLRHSVYSSVDLENESELGKTPSRGTVEV